MIKKTTTILSAVLILLVFASFVSADSATFNPPTPSNESTVDGDSIPYDLSLSTSSASDVASLDVSLYDMANDLIKARSLSNSLTAVGSFDSVADGTYYILASVMLTNGTTFESERRYVTMNNNLTIEYGDPTPLNGTLITLSSLPLHIKVYSSKDANISVYFYNSSGDVIDEKKGTSNVFDAKYDLLNDGNYSFSAMAFYGNKNATTRVRYISADTTPLIVSNISSSSIPSTLLPGSDLAFTLSFSVVEFPARIKVLAESTKAGYYSVENYNLMNLSDLPLNFSIFNISTEGTYTLYVVSRDNNGNIGKFAFASVSVASPSEPSAPTRSRGGNNRRGTTNTDQVNSTNVTAPENVTRTNFTSNESSFAPFDEEEESKGFGSFITGAVTGLFNKPSTAILTVLVIIAIIYVIVGVRNYFHSEKKPKKAEKNSEKEE